MAYFIIRFGNISVSKCFDFIDPKIRVSRSNKADFNLFKIHKTIIIITLFHNSYNCMYLLVNYLNKLFLNRQMILFGILPFNLSCARAL